MRIGFCGTQSVGKSTLVKELSKLPEFTNYHFATERSKYLRDLGIPLNTDSTLCGQTIFLAERCSELIKENIITDRTTIDVMAFTKTSKSIFETDKISFENYALNFINQYDYIFYISPEGIDLEDNGVRVLDKEYRTKIDNIIKEYLTKYKFLIKNLHELKGNTEERINIIKSIIF